MASRLTASAQARLWEGWRRSEAALRAGRPAAALRFLRDSADAERPGWHYLLSFRVRRIGGLRGALRDVDTAFRRDPGCAWVFALDAAPETAGAEGGCAREALKPFASARESAPVHAYLGQALLFGGRAEEGTAALEKAAALEPAGWISAWLGEAYRQAGRTNDALARFSEAVRLDARYANAYSWRASIHLAAARPAQARADLDRALRLQPTARGFMERSRARRSWGDWKGAMDDLESALRLNPELSWGRTDPEGLRRSLEELESASAALPGDGRLAAWRGETLLRAGRPEEAFAWLEAAAHGAPRFALAYTWLALARLELGQPHREARADAARALRLYPACVPALLASARCKVLERRPREALAFLDRAVRAGRYSARLRLARAALRARLGRRREALADAQRALLLCPGFEEAARLREALAAADAAGLSDALAAAEQVSL